MVPSSGSWTGGYEVIVSGTNLGNGSDITNVTLCGASVTSIDSQSSTQIVVTVGIAINAGLGDVRVFSTSFGETVKSNAFTYNGSGLVILGTNGAAVVNGESASVEKGTDFGSLAYGSAWTNMFSLTNSGDVTVTISGVTTNGAGSDAFAIFDPAGGGMNFPFSLEAGTTSNFNVSFAPPIAGAYTAAVELANNSATTPYFLYLAGTGAKHDQAALTFNPASPQTFNTTNALSASGGSGTGGVSYAVSDGPGQIVGLTNLHVTGGTGTVTVVATKAADTNYNSIAATGMVACAKADQALDFPAISDQALNNTLNLSATASSGLPVSFTNTPESPVVWQNPTTLTFSATGTVGIVASQAGDGEWNSAPGVTNTFSVTSDEPVEQTGWVAVNVSPASGMWVLSAPRGYTGPASGAGSMAAVTAVRGQYAISYGELSGYTAPAGQTQIVSAASTSVFSGVYNQPGNGTLSISLNKEEGTWTMSGPAAYIGATNGAGSLAAISAPTGSYTVSYGYLAGYRRPPTQTKEVTESAAAEFTGTYVVGQTPVDFGGEGVSDLTVYDPLTGRWFVWSPETGVIAWEATLGGPGFDPIPGDYNGDGRVDFAVYSNGYWYAQTLGGTSILDGVAFGGADFSPVAGDYDGDGITDMIVYHEGTGYWYGRTVAEVLLMWGNLWGGPGFMPVAGDFNNNGRTDMAVYLDGYWYIKTAEDEEIILFGLGWGGEGFTPVPGEYDGDGETDLAVYHEQSGYWFIIKLDGTLILWAERWGGPGFKAVTGDYDGDGISDLAVYYSGYWFVKAVDGTVLFYGEQWGAEGYDPVGR